MDRQTNTQTYPEPTKDWRPMKFFFSIFIFDFIIINNIGGLIHTLVGAEPTGKIPPTGHGPQGELKRRHDTKHHCGVIPGWKYRRLTNSAVIWQKDVSAYILYIHLRPSPIPRHNCDVSTFTNVQERSSPDLLAGAGLATQQAPQTDLVTAPYKLHSRLYGTQDNH